MRNTYIRKIRQSVSVALMLILLPLHSSLAQESSFRLTVSPLPITLTTQPGQAISSPIRIKNDSSSPETLKVSLMTFDADNKTGRPQLREIQPNEEFGQWVTFSEDEFTVGPGEWKSITATINVPPEAAFGYYYAVTFSRSTPQAAGENQQTAVVGGTAVLVLLEVRVPNAIRSIEVLDFSTDKPWYEFLPVNFTITVRNQGNVHAAPRGNIFIKRKNQEDIAILEVNLEQGNILPLSSRAFSSSWYDGFPLYEDPIENGKTVLDEEGKVRQKLTWDFTQAHKLRWGRYLATMLLVYDDGERDIPIEAEVAFWVLPWKIGAVIALIAMLTFVGLIVIGRKMLRSVHAYFSREALSKNDNQSEHEKYSI